MKYYLGVDVGGTKTHALIADESGRAVGFALAGTGSWEAVGYNGLEMVLKDVVHHAVEMADIHFDEIAGAGFGLAGYDWSSQKQDHLNAIAPLGLKSPIQIVNDAILGIPAGSEAGWGISIVSGTGCNCRGLSRDHQHEGRVVGGAPWSGEAAGGYDILTRAMQAVTFEWDKRGPVTELTSAFIMHTGAKNLDDLIEGSYIGRYSFDPSMILLVFEIARQGDPQALAVIRWAGQELGGLALGVINQLKLHHVAFDVVLIGSLFDGHPALQDSLAKTLHTHAPRARLVRLTVPPVVGAVLLGMEIGGVDFHPFRKPLIETTEKLIISE